MPTTVFELTKDYGLVILASSAVAFEYYLTPLIFVSPVRRRVFTKEFLEKNFGHIHRKEIGGEVPRGGYPDHGDGRYSQALSYKDWLDLSSAYRVHLNFAEQIGIIIPFTLIAGVRYPKVAAYLGFGYAVSRIVYGLGYLHKPSARNWGSAGISVITLALGALAALTGYQILTKKLV